MHIRNKQGAIELSIGTIVIIVIGMTMLILGILLVKNIFSGSTESVNELNTKIQEEIAQLFTDDSADVVVKLGSANTIRIKEGTDSLGVAIGAQTIDGSSTDRDRLKYTLTLDQNGDCINKIGLKNTENLFRTKLKIENSFDRFSGSKAFALVELSIPEGTPSCTQKVFIDVSDTLTNSEVGGSFFKVDVIKSGFF